MLRARVLRPYTDRFFRAAGLQPGMRVLDLGSGVGDVALLVGDIVGPCGHVLGLDRDAVALDRARQRTVEQGCSSWVSFQTTSLQEFSTSQQFDAVVGRYVLLYQPDPARQDLPRCGPAVSCARGRNSRGRSAAVAWICLACEHRRESRAPIRGVGARDAARMGGRRNAGGPAGSGRRRARQPGRGLNAVWCLGQEAALACCGARRRNHSNS